MPLVDPDQLEKENAAIYQDLPLDRPTPITRTTSAYHSAVAAVVRRTTSGLRHQDKLHTPLRLLVVKKQGNSSGPLECDIRVSDLQDFPVYEALSYVWGDRQHLTLIKCCGKPFAIRDNLYSALKRLRRRDEDRVLWTDAICINQSDPQERAEQVGFMGRIYAAARRVLVWLGEPLQADHTAFDSITTLKEKIPERHLRLKSSQVLDTEVQSYEALNALRFRHLLRFFSRPWFERVWVIQEVVRAKHADVLYGKYSMPWEDFAKVVLSFNDAIGYLVTNFGASTSLVQAVTAIENLPAMISLREDHERMSLFAILCIASTFKSTDPRDKLFAVLSLGDPSVIRIQPDYISDYFDIFRRHVIYELTIRHRLQYLARPPVHSTPSWPSWIPNWTEVSRSSYFYTAVGHGFRAAGTTKPSLSVSADEKILAVAGKQVDSITDLVEPINLRSINGTNATELLAWLEECMAIVPLDLEYIEEYAESVLSPLLRTFACTGVHGPASKFVGSSLSRRWVSSSASLSSSSASASTDPDTADIRRILIKIATVRFPRSNNDSQLHQQKSHRSTRSLSHSHSHSHSRSGSASSSSRPHLISRGSHSSNKAISDNNDNDVAGGGDFDDDPLTSHLTTLASKLYPAIADRQFLKTANGRLGWVSRRARVGDTVAIMFGGDVPFVLRRLRDKAMGGDDTASGLTVMEKEGEEVKQQQEDRSARWQVIGECYVDGLMQGEAVFGEARTGGDFSSKEKDGDRGGYGNGAEDEGTVFHLC